MAAKSSSPPSRQHDEGAGALAEALVGHGHDRHLGDRGVGVEQLLDLGHRHLLAAAVDDVLDAPGDPQLPVAVERGEVAAAIPAVGGDRLRGQVGPVEVAVEQAVGEHLEVALGVRGELATVVVDDPQGDVGHRTAVARPRALAAGRRARRRPPGSSRSCPRRRRPRPAARSGPRERARAGSPRRWRRTCAAPPAACRARRRPARGRRETASRTARTSPPSAASRQSPGRRPTPPAGPAARRGAGRSTSRRESPVWWASGDGT